MNEILTYMLRYCSFLWVEGGYRFADSNTTSSFGNAYVVVSSPTLRMRFVRDRGQLFLDFQEAYASEKSPWYSIDLVRRLLTGARQTTAELSEDYAIFLQASLREIEERFSNEKALSETKRQLEDLKRMRAKELFG